MDYLTNAANTVSGLLTSGKERVLSLWTPAAPAAPANTSSTPTVGARRKTYRKKAKKSKRRRTGRMSTGFPRLFRM